MAKFTCEIDTDKGIIDLMKDGKSIEADSFSIGCYSSCDYCSGEEVSNCYFCYSYKDDDGITVSNSISFKYKDEDDSKAKQEFSTIKLSSDFPKQIKNLVELSKASSLLQTALCKKK